MVQTFGCFSPLRGFLVGKILRELVGEGYVGKGKYLWVPWFYNRLFFTCNNWNKWKTLEPVTIFKGKLRFSIKVTIQFVRILNLFHFSAKVSEKKLLFLFNILLLWNPYPSSHNSPFHHRTTLRTCQSSPSTLLLPLTTLTSPIAWIW